MPQSYVHQTHAIRHLWEHMLTLKLFFKLNNDDHSIIHYTVDEKFFFHTGDNWEEARCSGKSKLHILEKIAINLQLKKCLLSNDTRLPG